MPKSIVDADNIEQSIKQHIYHNNAENWTIDKNYADNLEYTLQQEEYDNTKIPVRLKCTGEGLYLPDFWKCLKRDYFDNDAQFEADFYGIDEDYQHEEEILIPTPSDYEIYNLDEIKQLMKEGE